jgi:hypothetical protein
MGIRRRAVHEADTKQAALAIEPGTVDVRLSDGAVVAIEVPDLNNIDYNWVASRARAVACGYDTSTQPRHAARSHLRRLLRRRVLSATIEHL